MTQKQIVVMNKTKTIRFIDVTLSAWISFHGFPRLCKSPSSVCEFEIISRYHLKTVSSKSNKNK